MVKEKPILFSGEMIRAILDGRKSQTRRVIRKQPDEDGLSRNAGYPFVWYDTSDKEYFCPYGQPGDRLWVRETWRTPKEYDHVKPSDIPRRVPIQYKADGVTNCFIYSKKLGRWRPSIHMPRWTSRITLEVTDVRVERVQDISEMDCYGEGRPLTHKTDPVTRPGAARFRDLWNYINEKRPGCSWDDNPWVWAITFKVLARKS
jgi:hypothetical protein